MPYLLVLSPPSYTDSTQQAASSNPHIAEERGQVVDDDGNEEDKYVAGAMFQVVLTSL